MPQIERFLREREIPFLGLENDYLWTDVERMKIRVEAFIEMIGGEV
jgi:benzoyl-CoA reductase/2-hydroxyglutaryl-CoA dehydratase subunit BcrC/BadD/HgdB